MSEKALRFWHKIDGPIGALFIAFAFGLVGYTIRGYEDGGIVATLVERVRLARMDERGQAAEKIAELQRNFSERALLRDQQVRVLIDQNKALTSLIAKDSLMRSAQLEKLNQAAMKAAIAADAADQKADAIKEDTAKLNKKLDGAVYPKAVIPQSPPWSRK